MVSVHVTKMMCMHVDVCPRGLVKLDLGNIERVSGGVSGVCAEGVGEITISTT